RGDLKLEVGLETSSHKLELLIAGIKRITDRREIEEANVLLSEIAANAVVITADYYTAPITIRDFNTVKQEVNLQSIKLLEELKIEIAGASTDIKIVAQPQQ
ncbi:MAG: hypothetical protein JNJ86_14320, partial [Chitinophagaceae bacterium]|nr:hypothetical protein [Chitinophagaceae bacterium]